MSRLTLGILTLYLNNSGTIEERKIFEHMTAEGEKLDIQVIVFTPSDIKLNEKKVRAHLFDSSTKKWSRKWVAIPQLVFDRSRIQQSHRMKELRDFKNTFTNIHYINKPIGNKWIMHKKLSTSSFIQSYLPQTIKFTKINDLTEMLKKYAVVYLKPLNGTGGRGILRIEKASEQMFIIEGRDYDRKIISPRMLSTIGLKDFLNKWHVTTTSHIIQQGINLTLSNGRVHDYRILIQKDGLGSWSVTGGAGRIGAPRSITANLHGGGTAIVMTRLMKHFINPNLDLTTIQEEINTLAIEIATFLEQQGYNLCELAIDIAIDQQGTIWIIELNPKPSREVFREIGEQERYIEAIRRPLEYARFAHLTRSQK